LAWCFDIATNGRFSLRSLGLGSFTLQVFLLSHQQEIRIPFPCHPP
jgi:hypothetical protein